MQAQVLRGKKIIVNEDLPFLILRSDFFESMFSSLLRYGSAGSVMIFNLGKEQGVEVVKDVISTIPSGEKEDIGKDLLSRVFLKLGAMGWGKFELIPEDQKSRFKIKVRNSPFLRNIKTVREGGGSYIRGLLTGVSSEIFEKDVLIKDVKEDSTNSMFILES